MATPRGGAPSRVLTMRRRMSELLVTSLSVHACRGRWRPCPARTRCATTAWAGVCTPQTGGCGRSCTASTRTGSPRCAQGWALHLRYARWQQTLHLQRHLACCLPRLVCSVPTCMHPDHLHQAHYSAVPRAAEQWELQAVIIECCAAQVGDCARGGPGQQQPGLDRAHLRSHDQPDGCHDVLAFAGEAPGVCSLSGQWQWAWSCKQAWGMTGLCFTGGFQAARAYAQDSSPLWPSAVCMVMLAGPGPARGLLHLQIARDHAHDSTTLPSTSAMQACRTSVSGLASTASTQALSDLLCCHAGRVSLLGQPHLQPDSLGRAGAHSAACGTLLRPGPWWDPSSDTSLQSPTWR